ARPSRRPARDRPAGARHRPIARASRHAHHPPLRLTRPGSRPPAARIFCSSRSACSSTNACTALRCDDASSNSAAGKSPASACRSDPATASSSRSAFSSARLSRASAFRASPSTVPRIALAPALLLDELPLHALTPPSNPAHDAPRRGTMQCQRESRGGPPYWRVIGVTGDIRGEGLDRPPLEAVFFPLVPAPDRPLWSPPRGLTLAIRTATDQPEQLAPAIRELVRELDATVPLGRVRTMEQVIAAHGSVARRTFAMLLLGTAGAMALVLSVVGLYGVVSYVVGQRRAEIGVRIALGARAAQVQRMVLADALRLAAIGVVLGIAGALVTTRLLRALLFEVSPTD